MVKSIEFQGKSRWTSDELQVLSKSVQMLALKHQSSFDSLPPTILKALQGSRKFSQTLLATEILKIFLKSPTKQMIKPFLGYTFEFKFSFRLLEPDQKKLSSSNRKKKRSIKRSKRQINSNGLVKL
jgi:hypothetical protein